MVFGIVGESLASCMVVHFQVYKWWWIQIYLCTLRKQLNTCMELRFYIIETSNYSFSTSHIRGMAELPDITWVHSNITVGTLGTVTYVTLHTTWRTPKEPKIDMFISPLKRLSTRWFKYTQFNVAILITMRRPNKPHLVEMRCYWWRKNRHGDRNVRSVQADVNCNVKYREP